MGPKVGGFLVKYVLREIAHGNAMTASAATKQEPVLRAPTSS